MEVSICDLPVLVARHRAPGHPRVFQVVGIIMTSYENIEVKKLFHPSDRNEDICEKSWTIAKMQFNAAYISFIAASHFHQTHAYPFTALAIGMERVMNRAHPFARLFRSYVWRNVGIAWNGIVDVFDGTTGLFSNIATISGPDFVVHFFPEFAKREEYNLANPVSVYQSKLCDEVLGDMKIFRYSRMYFLAFEEFARNFVNAFYNSDEDLLNDYELQSLIAELIDPEKANLNSHGYMPQSFFESKKGLVEFIARALYSQGFLHHVMNHKLALQLAFQGFPYRVMNTHKYFFPNLSTNVLELQGIPPQILPTEVCKAIDVTEYSGYSLFDDISHLVPQTFAFLQRNLVLGLVFKPLFFDLEDLHVFGYPLQQYKAVKNANIRLANRLKRIDKQIFRNEESLTLKEGAFIWVPAWGTAMHSVI